MPWQIIVINKKYDVEFEWAQSHWLFQLVFDREATIPYINCRVVDFVKVFPWDGHLQLLLAAFLDYERT